MVSINDTTSTESNGKNEWENATLVIPPVCPSSNGLCHIIEIRYFLVLNFDATGMSVSTDLKIPITIGKPLMSIMKNLQHINKTYSTHV